MRTVLYNGPFIPEIDAGYNIQANGVIINFLKDPFCFRYNIINESDKNTELNKPLNFIDENIKILNPLTATKLVEVPRYLYKEHIINKNEIIHKNVYVPYVGPVYKIKEVKVPIYKEKIKYIPKIIEKEKIYEIPKIEIKNKIQEKLVYLHKNNIKYKKLNHVVERVIPMLKTDVIEKTVILSNIQNQKILDKDETNKNQAFSDPGTSKELYKLHHQEKNYKRKKIEHIVKEDILQNNEVEEINEKCEIKYDGEIEEINENEILKVEKSKENKEIRKIEENESNIPNCLFPPNLSLSHEIKKKKQLDINILPQKKYLNYSELNLSNISSENTEKSFNLYLSENTN
ncbi:conserved Plasmodium protein, unknown function [Plasmodium gallinaceum]|uniref:Uncharacterized protein n=1 Tax=Plasmodium gallinaceum TaxID=5849 RepID=A0A1J1GQ64_PLAGA|nr:conserved Plasmodium protein, unknown function [Plasmodium gallinaceum]CRG93178.1 conserved Plasmodium protein, unknown function [Plasmodium gallinaceum]